MAIPLYDIWEMKDGHIIKSHPIAMQLHGYVAYFETQEKAEKYRDAVQTERKKQGLK